VTVADVRRARVEAHAFYRATIGGEHKIEAAEVEALRGRWIKRQKVPMVGLAERKSLQKGGVYAPLDECCGQTRRTRNQTEYLGAGKERCNALSYALAASARDEPMMNDGDAHS
jgi:hypothetical protein